MEFSQLAIGL